MRSQTLLLRQILTFLWGVGVVFCLTLFCISSHAQDQAPAEAQAQADEEEIEDSPEMEHVLVTGSRIKRIDIEGSLPVTLIDREQIERSGESALADFVRSLSFNSHGSYRTQMDGYEMGTAQVSLRGLGSGRSLVLVDGRRLVKAPRSTIYQDLNVIPIGAVERIEVLSDGASAVYGSDAIGGVINIITRDDYQGWELTYGRAMVDTKSGDRDWGTVMFGHSGENWNVQAMYSWNNRDYIFNRDFSWFEPKDSIESNNFAVLDPETLFPSPPWNLTAIPAGCSASDYYSTAPYPGSLSGEWCVYSEGFEATDEPSVDTRGAMLKFDYQFGNNWNAWLNGGWSETESRGQLDPMVWASDWFGFFGFQWPLPEWSPNNPTNPASAMYDPAFGPNVPVHYVHRFEPLGNYKDAWTTDLEDLQLGMTGRMGPFELDFGFHFTRSETDNRTVEIDGFTAHTLIIDGSYDLQNPAGSSDDVLSAMATEAEHGWEFEQDEFFATAAWDLFDIGGVPVHWLVGGEYREEDWIGNISYFEPAEGQRDVLALYFESLLTMSPALELSIAGRYDDYSDWGNNFSPKLSLRWRVFDQFVMRASWGEGFRAPELSILGEEPRQSYEWINDTQSCDALGWPPDCGIQYQLNHTVSDELGPEHSKQYSLGLVWEPSMHFNMVLDYYDIELTDEIKVFWPELLLYFESAGVEMPPGLGVERFPNGVLQSITAGWGNHGQVNTSGLDVTMNLAFPLGPGRWNSNLLMTRVLEDEWNGWDALKYAGIPDTRGTLSNYYEVSDFTLSWNVHYISSYGRGLEGSEDHTTSWTTHDFQAAWRAPWNGELSVGAQNAFNEEPPFDPDGYYETWLYDPFGRIVYAQYKQTF